ncbi:MAG: hypothetical protein RL514_1434 [Verrucomicrobiota bacterium]|jgi:secreted protein with Ig-like and vWFA domain/anti-sigma factor RsiW
MNLTPDDPKLTAYALGELDATERAAIETALARSPECRRAVAEIHALSAELTTELAADTATAKGALTAEPWTRAGDLQSPSAMSSTPDGDYKSPALAADADAPGEGNVIFLPWRHWRTLGMAAAAALVVGFFVTKAWQRTKPERMAKEEMSLPAARAKAVTSWAQRPTNQVAQSATLTARGATNSLVTVIRTNGSSGVGSVNFATVDGSAAAGTLSDGKLVIGGGFTSYNRAVPHPSLRLKATGTLATAVGLDLLSFSDSSYSVSENAGGSSITVALPGGTVGQTIVQFAIGDSTRHLANGRAVLVVTDNDLTTPDSVGRLHPDAAYPRYVENPFTLVATEPLSTFSTDVDTASYANVRRLLNQNLLPPRDAVRIEELLNYFTYDYAPPTGAHPFAAHVEVAGCPWAPEHRLVRVGLKGRELKADKRPPSNFVFLIDVSGSMSPVMRLPLIKQSLRALVKRMTENDRVAMVVYASSSGTVLESTSAVNKEVILAAIDRLEAGGSTNGGEGIQRAYDLAVANFIKGGVNRVLLCTDGDFNVGITDRGQLLKLIEEKAKSGVFLTTLGVGDDNFKDATLQQLADRGNGNYHYLDSVEEGHKVLVEQMNATLVTIAKDVKIQIEFNPAQASAYRLIGYEKRILAKQDFNNDAKDAGEIGAGHTVTALYEVVPPGVALRGDVDPLKYQPEKNTVLPRSEPDKAKPALNTAQWREARVDLVKQLEALRRANPVDTARVANVERQVEFVDNLLGKLGRFRDELLTLKLRYKAPDGDKSTLMEIPVTDSGAKLARASADFKFASAVASFGMVLKDSPFKGTATLDSALELAREGKGDDTHGYRAEFINLLGKAKTLKK